MVTKSFSQDPIKSNAVPRIVTVVFYLLVSILLTSKWNTISDIYEPLLNTSQPTNTKEHIVIWILINNFCEVRFLFLNYQI